MAPSSTSDVHLDLLILILQALVALRLPNHHLYLLVQHLYLDPGSRSTRHYQGIRWMNYVCILRVFFFVRISSMNLFCQIFFPFFFFSSQHFGLATDFYHPSSVVGGPKRPVPEKPQLKGGSSTEEGLASTAAGIAASASAMQANLYSRLASAVNERGYVCFSKF